MYQIKIVLKGKTQVKALLVLVILAATLSAADSDQDRLDQSWIAQLSAGPVDLPAQISGEDELFSLALANNSELKSQYADWQMRLEEAKTVVTLPDPSLSIAYFVEPVETAQGPQKAKVSLGQTIPWLSKTQSSREGKNARVDQAFDILNNSRLKLKRDVTMLWSEAAYLNAAFSIQTQKIALAKDLEEILNIQYQSAAISHKSLVDAQIQTLVLLDQLEDLKDSSYRLRIKLADLIEVHTLLPADVLDSATFETGESFEGQGIGSRHPRLQHLDDLQQEARALKNLARSEYLPDLKLGMEYILTDKRTVDGAEVAGTGRNPLIFSAGIAIPLWNWSSKKSGVKAAEWREKSVESLMDAELKMLQQDYNLTYSKLTEDLRQIELYEEQLIPRALEIEHVMEQSYISQGVDISTLTMVRQKRLEDQLSLLKFRHSAAIQMANLTYLEGE